MTIGITPKNEVLRVKSLKQPILHENIGYKNFSQLNFWRMHHMYKTLDMNKMNKPNNKHKSTTSAL